MDIEVGEPDRARVRRRPNATRDRLVGALAAAGLVRPPLGAGLKKKVRGRKGRKKSQK